MIAAEKAQEEQLGFYDRTSPTKVAVDLTFPEFIQHLPHLIDLQSVLSVAHKSCTEAGVILVSAQATDSHTPPEQLQRMEINLSLRGDYPKTKQALADVLDHFSNATVEHLALRRGSSPGWIDASVIIAQWGQPILSRPQAASSPTAR